MKLLYMGTSAAEGVPALFCKCRVCQNAREKKGRELRTRSQAIIDDKLLIDFPPDTYAHFLRFDFPLPDITHLLVTHCHTDHFYATDMEMRRDFLAHPAPPLMHIYANQTVWDMLVNRLPKSFDVERYFQFHLAEPFEKIDIMDYTVVPLPARHDPKQQCVIYSVTKGDKNMLYAHDTGYFPEDTWDYLSKSGRYDLISLDCTSMDRRDEGVHMGLPNALDIRARLMETGTANEDTVFVLHHFSHNGGLTHEEMVCCAEKEDFLVSYDGLEIDF